MLGKQLSSIAGDKLKEHVFRSAAYKPRFWACTLLLHSLGYLCGNEASLVQKAASGDSTFVLRTCESALFQGNNAGGGEALAQMRKDPLPGANGLQLITEGLYVADNIISQERKSGEQ